MHDMCQLFDMTTSTTAVISARVCLYMEGVQKLVKIPAKVYDCVDKGECSIPGILICFDGQCPQFPPRHPRPR